MKPRLFLPAFVFFGLSCGLSEAAAQSLPSTVEPGIQRDRLLDRDLLPRPSGPAVLKEIDCSAGDPDQRVTFTLRGVRLKREAAGGEGIDPAAYWKPYLGQDVTLQRICAIARTLAGDYAREIGRSLSAILPVQYIDGGIVRIAIVAE